MTKISMRIYFIIIYLCFSFALKAENIPIISVGIDELLNNQSNSFILKGKRVGILTNHTAVNSKMQKTIDILKQNAKQKGYAVTAIFAPEHGLDGTANREDQIRQESVLDGIPVYTLYGKTRRPTKEMLQAIDVLLYDIQDIGTRSYTYIATLFYAMEEAAKYKIPVVVLDRPNPINGLTVDGPMMEEKWRSMVGYINVPFCHGMTVGELARFFNEEYNVGCDLTVIPLKGWKRSMSFDETGLAWIPTSPQIPEASTALYYPMTGLIGELKIVSIGVGYTLPFKVIGAPWIDADSFAQTLNEQRFPGISFQPFHYRPFFGRYAHQECHGVLLVVTDPKIYKPVTTQFLLIGMLKSLYPEKFQEVLKDEKAWKQMFCKVNGTEEIFKILANDKYVVWKLRAFHERERSQFLEKRKKYLLAQYAD